MTKPIEFWFDFSSGYAFFAAARIEALAKRVERQVLWRPYMLGTAYQVTGARGLSSTPLKRDYARRDWARLARAEGLEFHLPKNHPLIALAATRAFYWIESQDAAAAPRFAQRVFAEYYGNGLDTSDIVAVSSLAPEFNATPEALVQGAQSPEIKAHTKSLAEGAIARGVFGSPFFFADDEPFWGWDRMGMMEDWLKKGGW
ncbi:DSBA oxidoreductase [Candidatus Filomicrobium marinum]|uniref:2-hydroxychromene-2-carboxylate isomerase n=2 Tax=Filomicrobium TaxID=119044 RepID=A0A0D6JCG4_9HYPH|nr:MULTISPECIES: 2-hydroxychromene-2-carboxylate isomerase [Filomicrobium]CFX08906.1 DSBA oxidoreductase [Candidatus Filomicrobium marinum]CPR16869.1 DSBA oxidoreductase [Candidatus Filomicrobium marinum]SDO43541.1 2-hydroxychromene-2-carboxylate isomerase [Filomicrobium insigne]